MSVFTHSILYDANGHNGKNYYVVAIRRSDGYAWNWTAKAMQDDPVRTFCALECPEIGTSGRYKINLDSDLPRGVPLDLSICERAGATPANSDDQKELIPFTYGDFGF